MTLIRSVTVTHLLAPTFFGGLETVVAALAEAQAGSGQNVSVVLLVSGDRRGPPCFAPLEASGVRVYWLRIPPRRYGIERRGVRDLLFRSQAEILHTHGYRPDVVDSPVASKLGLATVSTVHGFTAGRLKNRAYEWLQRRALRRLDAVVAVSEAMAKTLRISGVKQDRLHVVRNAWSPQVPFLDRWGARRFLGIPEDATVVGWAGRMTEEKAPDIMLRALALLPPSIELSLIGDGPMARRLATLANTLGLTSRVRWHGAIRQAATCFRAFDAFCLTSWTEGTPMVLLEAMAAGIPIVATAVGGVPEVVSLEEAVLVPPGDPQAFAEGLGALLVSPERGRQQTERALIRVRSDHSPKPWVRRYQDIYEKVLTR